MAFVTIDTRDGRTFNGVRVEKWQSYQEALNDETESRGIKRARVDKVWSEGQKIYDAKNPSTKYGIQEPYY